jgi:putative transposase
MASLKSQIAGRRPIELPDEVWAEAVRRAAVIRPLAAETTNSCAAVRAAATALGLSAAQVYRLVRVFRGRPLTQSLVLNRPGRRLGTRLLPPQVEQRIEDAIEVVFKQRERPSVARLRRDIRQKCDAAGLAPPSRKAIKARISVQSLKDLAKARDGAKVARQRFVPVKPGLRPRALLEIVQIDHTKVESNSWTTWPAPSWAGPGSPCSWTCIPAACWACRCRSIRRRQPASRSPSPKAFCRKPNGSPIARWT